MEAFLWVIQYSIEFFAQILSYVAQNRILGLFLLLWCIGLILGALTGTKSDNQGK